MISKLLAIVIESSLGKSDHMYISTLLQNFYVVDSTTKLKFIPLDGKPSYNYSKVEKAINNLKKQSSYDEFFVIYCLDTDKFDTNPDDNRLNSKITEYCNTKNYDIVWFCRDIEDVIWGKPVSDSEKQLHAQKFIINKYSSSISETKLNQQPFQKKKSNFLKVFDKYLTRSAK